MDPGTRNIRTSTVGDGSPDFDVDAAMTILGGDWDLFWTIVDLFFDGWSGVDARFDQAIRDRDPEELRQAAHYLKGSSANVGAARVRALSADLEKRAAEGRIADADERVAEIRRAMTAYTDELARRRPA